MNLDKKRDFLCIIAGYRDKLEEQFFARNPGLRRRFAFDIEIDGYAPNELKDIFMLKVNESGWTTEFKINDNDSQNQIIKKHKTEQNFANFFEQNINYFPHYGGDIETYFLNCKICHSKRVIFMSQSIKKILTKEDFKNGFDKFIGNRKVQTNDYIKMYS